MAHNAVRDYQRLAADWTPVGWVIEYRERLTGRCYYRQKKIATPRPTTLLRLHIYLHECGHAHLHARGGRSGKPVHRIEYEAETWAFSKMRQAGIEPDPASVERAKASVRRQIRPGIKCGGQWIDVEAAQWSDWTG